jgi:hypothetical protein
VKITGAKAIVATLWSLADESTQRVYEGILSALGGYSRTNQIRGASRGATGLVARRGDATRTPVGWTRPRLPASLLLGALLSDGKLALRRTSFEETFVRRPRIIKTPQLAALRRSSLHREPGIT